MIDTSHWIPAQITIDNINSGIYDCYLDPGKRWNGWVMPYFTFDQACAVMNNYHNINPDEYMSYNEQLDRFEISDEHEIIEAYTAVETDLGTFYGIGTGLWTWFLIEEA